MLLLQTVGIVILVIVLSFVGLFVIAWISEYIDDTGVNNHRS